MSATHKEKLKETTCLDSMCLISPVTQTAAMLNSITVMWLYGRHSPPTKKCMEPEYEEKKKRQEESGYCFSKMEADEKGTFVRFDIDLCTCILNVVRRV